MVNFNTPLANQYKIATEDSVVFRWWLGLFVRVFVGNALLHIRSGSACVSSVCHLCAPSVKSATSFSVSYPTPRSHLELRRGTKDFEAIPALNPTLVMVETCTNGCQTRAAVWFIVERAFTPAFSSQVSPHSLAVCRYHMSLRRAGDHITCFSGMFS